MIAPPGLCLFICGSALLAVALVSRPRRHRRRTYDEAVRAELTRLRREWGVIGLLASAALVLGMVAWLLRRTL